MFHNKIFLIPTVRPLCILTTSPPLPHSLPVNFHSPPLIVLIDPPSVPPETTRNDGASVFWPLYTVFIPNTSTSFFPEKKFNSLIGNKLYSYLLLTMLDSLISLNALIAILTFTISGGPARDGHRVLRFVQFLFIYIVKRALSFLIFLNQNQSRFKTGWTLDVLPNTPH